jgi:hypothetical protein
MMQSRVRLYHVKESDLPEENLGSVQDGIVGLFCLS